MNCVINGGVVAQDKINEVSHYWYCRRGYLDQVHNKIEQKKTTDIDGEKTIEGDCFLTH